MNAKLSHFSELSYFLSEKSTVCNDFLSLLDRFRLGQSLRKLEKQLRDRFSKKRSNDDCMKKGQMSFSRTSLP